MQNYASQSCCAHSLVCQQRDRDSRGSSKLIGGVARRKRPKPSNFARRFLGLAIACAAFVGCGDDSVTHGGSSSPADLRPLLTGSASLALEAPNKFRSTPNLGIGELTLVEAEDFARRFLASYGRLLEPELRARSRVSVEFSDLHLCRQSAIARPLALQASVSEMDRRRRGAHWLVGVCQRDEIQVLSLSFSVYARDVAGQRPADGILNPDGSDLLAIPVLPSSQADGVPGSAEGAVAQLFAAGQVRINEPPQLVQPELPFAPQLSRWAMRTETAIAFSSEAKRTGFADRFLVGPLTELGRLYVLTEQPGRLSVEASNASLASPERTAAISRRDPGLYQVSLVPSRNVR